MKRIIKSWWKGMKTVAAWYDVKDYRVLPLQLFN